MKKIIQILSDVHLEFYPTAGSWPRVPISPEADIILIAGDVSCRPDSLTNFLLLIKEKTKAPVFFVPGNHEYYLHDICLYPERLLAAVMKGGATPLDNAVVTCIKDIKITKEDFSSLININNIPFWNHRIHQEQKTFSFLIPIFNDDKTLAWVEYFFNCASCGYGKNVLFRKINNKWIIIDSYVTWHS